MAAVQVPARTAWGGLLILPACVMAGVVGALIAWSSDLGLVLAAAVFMAGGLAMRAWMWAVITVLFALLSPAIANLDLGPTVVKFFDIPFAWAGLASALLRTHVRRAENETGRAIGRVVVGLLGLLALAVGLSFAFHPAEFLRPLVYFLLIGQPFALVAALLLDPPAPRARRYVEHVFLGLALVQVPVALIQATRLGLADHVQGTLYGKGAGSHLLGGVAIVAGTWILTREGTRREVKFAAIALFALPLLADAKQAVLAAAAIGLLAASRRRAIPAGVIVAGLIGASLLLYPAGRIAVAFVERARAGQWGKIAAAEMVMTALRRSPADMALGLGPATTVSRAAFMTTPLLLHEDSPLRALGLEPADFAIAAEAEAVRLSGGQTSFNSAQSSALGVLGDTGIAGLGVYLALIAILIRACLRNGTAEGRAIAGMWCMWLLLGVVFDWWEEPPFTIPIALLTGLHLSRDGGHQPVAPELSMVDSGSLRRAALASE